jgi:HEAT repeat protein
MVVLTNRQHPYRVFAIDYIGDFGTNAAIAIPELVEALQDTNRAVRIHATNSLRKVVSSSASMERSAR